MENNGREEMFLTWFENMTDTQYQSIIVTDQLNILRSEKTTDRLMADGISFFAQYYLKSLWISH